MPGALVGRVALVTGGGSGIGRACAVRFSAEGAAVVVGDVAGPSAAETADLIQSRGGKASYRQADIRLEGDNDALVATAVATFGRLDALVAAAGILHAGYVSSDAATGEREHQAGHVVNKRLEHWERVISVNLTGTMLTNRAVARQLLLQGEGGAIVNIASAAASIPLAGSVDYCCSKAGVVMLTKVLALELASAGIRVNAIGPGAIATPMIAATLGDETRRRRVELDTPLGRLGQPSDIADVALFLASDQSAYLTGEVIYPTGGRFTGR